MRGKKAIYLLSAIVPASLLCVFVDAQERSAKSNSRKDARVSVQSDGLSHLEELVTGDVEHLRNVVAGYEATLKFYFTPLPGTEPSLAYPAGWNIDGQKLTVSRGGFTSAWITQIEGWGTNADYVLLRAFQDKIDAASFKGANASPPNPDCDLVYPNATPCHGVCVGGPHDGNTCSGASDCPRTCLGGSLNGFVCQSYCPGDGTCAGSCIDISCPMPVSKLGATCGTLVGGFCDSAGQDTTRSDWVFASVGPNDVTAINAGSPTGPIFAGTVNPGLEVHDTGGRFYTGTLLLPVPTCAKGTYTIQHKPDETFAGNQTSPLQAVADALESIPIAALVTGVLEIQLGSCCTEFTTPSSATCTDGMTLDQCNALSSSNLHIFRANADCGTPCDVECVTAGDCDDHKFCTDDSCTSDGHCVHAHTDAVCDDGVNCTTDVCVAASDSCIHTTVDAVCDDGLYCNGFEFCAANGCQLGQPPCGFGETCDETNDSCGLTPIPTVSQWGLAVLALLLAIGAKVGFRRAGT